MDYPKLVEALTVDRSVPKNALNVALVILNERLHRAPYVRRAIRWALLEQELICSTIFTWTGERPTGPKRGMSERLSERNYASEIDAPASPRYAYERFVAGLLPTARIQVSRGPAIKLAALKPAEAQEVAFALCDYIQARCAELVIYPCVVGRDDRLKRTAIFIACVESILGTSFDADLLDDWGRAPDGKEETRAFLLDREGMDMMAWEYATNRAARDLRIVLDIDEFGSIPRCVWRASALLHRDDDQYIERHCPIWWLKPCYSRKGRDTEVRSVQELNVPFWEEARLSQVEDRPRDGYLLTGEERMGLATMVAMLLAGIKASEDGSYGRIVIEEEAWRLDFDVLAHLLLQLLS